MLTTHAIFGKLGSLRQSVHLFGFQDFIVGWHLAFLTSHIIMGQFALVQNYDSIRLYKYFFNHRFVL